MTRTPLSRSKGQRSRSPGRFAHHRVGASGGCSGGRENVLAVGNCCYVAVCSAAGGASAPTGEERGGGIPYVAAARLQLVTISNVLINWCHPVNIQNVLFWLECRHGYVHATSHAMVGLLSITLCSSPAHTSIRRCLKSFIPSPFFRKLVAELCPRRS